MPEGLWLSTKWGELDVNERYTAKAAIILACTDFFYRSLWYRRPELAVEGTECGTIDYWVR